MSNPSGALQALRALRRGRGLTHGALSKQPALLAALHARDAQDGYDRLLALLTGLGDSIQARALRNAYGIGMSDPRNLTIRRNDFATVSNRHVDTIEGYENDAIDDIMAQLAATAQATPVIDNRHRRITLDISAQVQPNGIIHSYDLRFTTRAPGEVHEGHQYMRRSDMKSMPLLMYHIPLKLRVGLLSMAVAFAGAPPKIAYALRGPTVFDILAQNDSKPLELQHSRYFMTSFDPVPDNYYAIYWG